MEAISALGGSAGLELQGYGSMSWNARKQRWSITVRGGGDPVTVTVCGVEGCESAPAVPGGGGVGNGGGGRKK